MSELRSCRNSGRVGTQVMSELRSCRNSGQVGTQVESELRSSQKLSLIKVLSRVLLRLIYHSYDKIGNFLFPSNRKFKQINFAVSIFANF